MKFEMTDWSVAKAEEFVAKIRIQMIAKQRAEMSPDDFEHLTGGGTMPYSGAIGGAVSYIFTPTSIGTAVVVRAYREELDVTDYGEW